MDVLNHSLLDSKQSNFPMLSQNVAERLNKLRQWNQSLRESQSSNDTQWKELIAMIDYQCQCVKSFLQGIHHLPGVTGESNELWLEPRGETLIIIDESMPAVALGAALCAALASDNPVRLSVHPDLQSYQQGCLDQLLGRFINKERVVTFDYNDWRNQLKEPSVKVACIAAKESMLIEANQVLANREGPVVILLHDSDPMLPSFSTPTFCLGFNTEKTCTINTTAIGGNASLLEMGAGMKV
ncbi:MAG: hypothetical protein CENE_03514 [Candidatus Celerinatantimonas neptuna]|nr:MAG: hypothetical protein CENE_03514 [Candidatus Celerinatantimonas neptuna]